MVIEIKVLIYDHQDKFRQNIMPMVMGKTVMLKKRSINIIKVHVIMNLIDEPYLNVENLYKS